MTSALMDQVVQVVIVPIIFVLDTTWDRDARIQLSAHHLATAIAQIGNVSKGCKKVENAGMMKIALIAVNVIMVDALNCTVFLQDR
jgi:hypothetical protein